MKMMVSLKSAIDAAGGTVAAAKVCGVSLQAVHKWLSVGRLPRTEYSGETKYAKRLAAASGNAFSPEQLLDALRPGASSITASRADSAGN